MEWAAVKIMLGAMREPPAINEESFRFKMATTHGNSPSLDSLILFDLTSGSTPFTFLIPQKRFVKVEVLRIPFGFKFSQQTSFLFSHCF